MSGAYYNENDPKAAATLRELIKSNLIAAGEVDERSIEDVTPNDIAGFTQVHLFAGFGIWSLALRMAGWPDDLPVWTASCPCQPFSQTGKGNGFSDDRHLWPAAFWLLQHGKQPQVPCYGEQVASPDGLTWLDLVRADLEAVDHSLWSVVLASAGFGAPIIRQRSYWMASSKHDGSRREIRLASEPDSDGENGRLFDGSSTVVRLDSSVQPRLEGLAGNGDGENGRSKPIRSVAASSEPSGMGSTSSERSFFSSFPGVHSGEKSPRAWDAESQRSSDVIQRPSATNGFWRDVDWLRCRDDKWRPVEPGTFPLAHGYPERMGILRGAGNAISPQVAAAFIEATREAGLA